MVVEYSIVVFQEALQYSLWSVSVQVYCEFEYLWDCLCEMTYCTCQMKMKYSTLHPYGEWLARQVLTLEDSKQPDAAVANSNVNKNGVAGVLMNDFNGNGNGNGNGYVRSIPIGSNGVSFDECGGIMRILHRLKAFGYVPFQTFPACCMAKELLATAAHFGFSTCLHCDQSFEA